MAIERLTLKNAVTAATFFAGNLNGQDYRYAASALLTYIQSNLSLPGIFTTQYSSPSATAFSVTITDGSSDNTNVHLILTPTGAFAAGTITLPPAAECVDGQEVLVNCTQAVTTLTVAANGATAVTGEPSGLSANDFFRLKYDKPTLTWYRVG
jgi:hypothetical protein